MRRPLSCAPGSGWLVRLAVLVALVAGIGLLAAPAALAWPFDACKSPPIPSGPAGDIAGLIDTAVLQERGGVSGIDPYGQYGYGGLHWSTYDTGCVVGDVGAEIDTLFGSFFLELAVITFASQMAMTGLLADDSVHNAVGEAANQSSVSFYDVVFSPWAGAAAAVTAAVMLVATGKGDTGKVLTRAGLVVVAVAIAALSFGSGGQLSRELSGTLRGALADINSGVARTFPAGSDDAEYSMRNILYRELLWRAWKDGQVGPEGREDLAWGLFQEQALTPLEASQLEVASKEQEEAVFQTKGEAWMALADSARPSEYRTIQGSGSSRFAAAVVALLKLAPIALLQIFCGLTLYMMYAFLALLPVAAPILGLAALVFPGVPEKAVRVIGNVMAGGIVAALVTIVHTVVVLHLSNGDLGAWSTILFIWVATYILWKLIQPLVSLTSILSAALGTGRVNKPNGRSLLLAALLFRGRGARSGPPDPSAAGGWSPASRTGPGGGAGGGGGGPRPRPENRPSGGALVPRPAGGLGGGGGGGGPGGGPRYWRLDVEWPGGTAGVAPSGSALGAAPTGDDSALPAGGPSRNLPARRGGGEASFLRAAGTGAHPHGQPASESPAMYHASTGADPFARPDLRAAERIDTTGSGAPVYRITGLYAPPPRRPPASRSSGPAPVSPPPSPRPRPELRRADS